MSGIRETTETKDSRLGTSCLQAHLLKAVNQTTSIQKGQDLVDPRLRSLTTIGTKLNVPLKISV